MGKLEKGVMVRKIEPIKLWVAFILVVLTTSTACHQQPQCVVTEDQQTGAAVVRCMNGTTAELAPEASLEQKMRCTLLENQDGTSTIICPDGTTTTWQSNSSNPLILGRMLNTCTQQQNGKLKCWGAGTYYLSS